MLNQASSASQQDFSSQLGSQMNSRKKPSAISPTFRHLQPKDYQKYTEMPARTMHQYNPVPAKPVGQDYARQSNASKSHRSSQRHRSGPQEHSVPKVGTGTTFGKEKRGLLVREQEQLATSDQRKSLRSGNGRNLLNQSMHS